MAPINLPAEGVYEGPVFLRALAEVDVPAFVEALRDPGISEYAYGGRLAAEDAAVAAAVARNPGRMESGEGVLLAVCERGLERMSGLTMIFRIDSDDRSGELGFWTAPWARGRGLNLAALRLTLGLAFGHLGLERLCALTDVENLPAQRALERAGFVREGVLRGLTRTERGRKDEVSYGLLMTDWPTPGLGGS